MKHFHFSYTSIIKNQRKLLVEKFSKSSIRCLSSIKFKFYSISLDNIHLCLKIGSLLEVKQQTNRQAGVNFQTKDKYCFLFCFRISLLIL